MRDKVWREVIKLFLNILTWCRAYVIVENEALDKFCETFFNGNEAFGIIFNNIFLPRNWFLLIVKNLSIYVRKKLI